MSNKRINFLITCIFLYVFSFTAYADDSTHGGGDLFPETINPDKEGYVCDIVDLDCAISKLDGDTITTTQQCYGKVYINTHPENRGYIWVCSIKKYGGLRLMYATDETIENVSSGCYTSSVLGFGNPPDIQKPSFSLDFENWTVSDVFSPMDLSCVPWWGGDDCSYDFKIKVDSTLPVYCKSFDTVDEYNDWYNAGYYNIKEHPDQDYSKFGFTNDGNLSDGNIYDLQVPLNTKCQKFIITTRDSLKAYNPYVTWNQSDEVDVQDWHTEVYVRMCGKARQYPWSKYEKFDTGYVKQFNLYQDVYNYKNKCSFKGSELYDCPCTPDMTGSYYTSAITEYYIRLRNYYFDESTNLMHYSNWVTWYVDKDGAVRCVENLDHDVTNTDDDNVKIDSENYNPSEDYTSKNKGDNSSSSLSLDSFLDYLKQAVAAIGDIPDLMSVVFSWLPSIFVTIIVTGIALLILLRILGR